ncbi:muscarinic acetylcholine receptor M4-like [Paramacrobiotus metropolitanus]|uniref:muscarinic acetylcholine receptor M4-like n=1 Tax=Paramacrobiotus metropolitanus TaxID=2943436 RepID=UPI0024457555|nr:muscarinic acetylcholine receptor M4-like [Paramacrobiotus metropolitanus]
MGSATNLTDVLLSHSNTTSFPSPANASAVHQLSPGIITTTVLSVTFNVLGVLFALSSASLRTPFNVYIVALMCSNIAFETWECSMLGLMDAYGLVGLGSSVCTLRLYGVYVLAPIVYHTHFLITLNRAWAILWPVSYRARHNHTVAGLLCAAMVGYVHLMMLPELLRDHLYYRLPLEYGCWLNAARQVTLTEFTSIWMYDVPCACVYIIYPFLLWKMLARRRAKRRNRSDNPAAQRAPLESSNRPFILLTLYTCSTLVCWLPIMIFYLFATFFPAVPLSPAFFQGTSILYNLQSILDPLIFAITASNVLYSMYSHGFVIIFDEVNQILQTL